MTLRQIQNLILIPMISLSTVARADEYQLMHSEGIGMLKIGLTRKQALQILGNASTVGQIEEWGADGLFHQQLVFKSVGVSLSLVSKSKASPQTVESITAVGPCLLTTRRGVRIGSLESELVKAYGRDFNKEESTPGSYFIAGSIYGGVCFKLKSGRVIQIFLGAANE